MRIHNSLRNNFLGVLLLLVLVLPSVVGARVARSEDLYPIYSNNETEVNSVSISTAQNLAHRLKTAKSKFDPEEIRDNPNKVFAVNTPNNSTFYYDPTPEDSTNKDVVLLGTVTNKDDFYVAPNKTTLKESKEGDDFLNRIDKLQKLPPGTTLATKNAGTNLQNEKDLQQQKYDELHAKELEAANNYNNYTGTDTAQKAALLKAMQDAKLAADNQGRNVGIAGHNQAQLLEQQRLSAISSNSACSLSTSFSFFDCTLSIVGWLTNIIFKLTSFLAYIAGTLFDYSLELSINSAQFFKKLGVIEVTWSFIRDILNMTFIFILLWTAVQILIGNDAKYNAKQVLTKVIIVAILINFSLFAAKLMVDGSNIVSLKIYETMKSNAESTDATISERIMNTVGLSTLYNITDIFTEDKTKVTSGCANNPGALITISVMGSIFLIILTLALGLAAILFLVRLVNIIILFIKSPLWVWGYVLPGNASISKLKDEWWSQMKHVLTFPIAYLFWMLVAVIIFDSLGSARGTGGGLLNIICTAPSAQGLGGRAGEMISLVAIFCIVIIFMMKAIEYGVSHAAGPQGSVGGAFSKNWANKFAGYQTAMTRGLAKKAGNGALAVGGMSVGAANRGLLLARDTTGRLGGSLIGGVNSMRQKEGFGKGAKDGFFNPGIATKEALRDMARKTVVGTQGGVLDYLGVTSKAAKLAEKYKDPVNSANETKKQADTRRSNNAAADETRRAAAVEEQFKILSVKDWQKKNAGGTVDQYKAYVENKIEARTDVVYGKNIIKTSAKNGSTHLENIRNAAVVEYEEEKRDANGRIERDAAGKAIMEKKFKLDEYAMRGAMQSMAKEDKVKDLLKQKKTKFTTLQNIKAEARTKALDANERTQRMTAKKKTNDSDQTTKYENEIPDLKETIEKMELQKGDVDAAVGAKVQLMINPQKEYNGKAVRDVNSAIAKLNIERRKGAGADPAKILRLEEGLSKAHRDYTEHITKTKSDLARKETDYMDHLAKLDEKK